MAKKRSALYEEYHRVRKNLQTQMSKMRKKKYEFGSFKLPSIPKRITKGSIRRLQKINLYSNSYVRTGEVRADTGEIIEKKVQGNIFQRATRKLSAKRAARTRRKRARQERRAIEQMADTIGQSFMPRNESDFVAPEVDEGAQYGDIILAKLQGLIEGYSQDAPVLSGYLTTLLAQSDRQQVVNGLSQYTEADIDAIESDLFYEATKHVIRWGNVTKLAQDIKGAPLSAQDMSDLRNAREADEEADEEDYE